MQYSPQALFAEMNGYKQFLLQIAVTNASQTIALPTKLLDGSGTALPSNCMLVLQSDVAFNYYFCDSAGAINATTNPGTLVAINAQEHVRRAVNFNNLMTHIAVKATGNGTLNIFYVSIKTDIPQSGDLSIY